MPSADFFDTPRSRQPSKNPIGTVTAAFASSAGANAVDSDLIVPIDVVGSRRGDFPPGTLRVLILEDEPSDAENLERELQRAGFAAIARRVDSEQEFIEALESPTDVILSDYHLPAFDGLEALQLVRQRGLDTPFIMVSGAVAEDTAVLALQEGADDYLFKDRLGRLGSAVRQAMERCDSRREKLRTQSQSARLAAIVQSSEDAITANTLEGILTDWNPGAERLFGYSADEVLGTRADAFIPSDKLRESHAVLAELRRGVHVVPFETVRLHRDGQRIDVSIAVSPVKNEDGVVVGVSTIARDVTVRKRAEQSLRDSEDRYRRIIETSTEGIWTLDACGKTTFVNRRIVEMLGYTVEEMMGKSLFDFAVPEAREEADHHLEQSRYGFPEQNDFGFRRKDGSEVWTRLATNPIYEDAGRHAGTLAMVTDVSEQRRAERSARRLSAERDRLMAQLQLQIERMPLGYLLLGPDLRYTHWNPAAERIFGYRQAEIIGKTPFETIVPPHARPGMEELFQRLARGDMAAHDSGENITRDGRTLFCQWHNTPLHHPDGSFAGILSMAQDLTERKRLESQYLQSQKMEAVGRLAGGVAHDFNNILTVMNGYSDLLLQDMPPENPGCELLRQIVAAGQRAAALTNQLLAFSRQQAIAPQILDLNVVVTETLKLLRRVIGEDVHLNTAFDRAYAGVLADPGQVVQVLMNLAVNARDAMPKGGKLTIGIRVVELDQRHVRAHAGAKAGPHVLLTVSDTGRGMPPEVLARIFEPFFTTKGPGKGTGLGLAVVQGVVETSGGHVLVRSEVEAGTTFEIYLPQVEARPALEREVEPSPLPRGAETVLVVEDEDGVRALLQHILGGCGYAVLEACDGEKALRIAAQHQGPIHLLATDVVMPGLGGREVADGVSRLHPETKVLFLSGYTDDAVVRHGIRQAEVHFLQKPFSSHALARKVREVLNEA